MKQAIRADADLRLRIEALVAQRDSGMHSLGDIWRRHRLSCPTREQLGSYLLEAMLQDSSDYLRFHIEVIGCRYCRANLADLQLAQDQAKQSEATVAQRRKRIFQSSVGRMRTFPEDN